MRHAERLDQQEQVVMRKELWDAFEDKDWSKGGKCPRSGRGSNMRWTKGIRAALPGLFKTYNVKTFLDAPCGDWFWMQKVDLTGIDYIGADIAKGLIDENIEKHTRENVRFAHMDVTSDDLPMADMMMCRDCLFHLQFPMRWAFYENFVASKIPYLLSTVEYVPENVNLDTSAQWRAYNPFLPPFNLSDPLELVHERGDDLSDDWRVNMARDDATTVRSMGVWSRDQIIETLARRDAAADG
jgi:hypothetical protein